MRYEDIRIGECFENSGYKWLKTIMTKEPINMRLNENPNRKEVFSTLGAIFQPRDKVNFVSSWDYTCPIADVPSHLIHVSPENALYDVIYKIADGEDYFVKKWVAGGYYFVCVSGESERYGTGGWYYWASEKSLELVLSKTFVYSEGSI